MKINQFHVTHSRVGIPSVCLVLRHSDCHFMLNSGGIACCEWWNSLWHSALCLNIRVKKWKYNFTNTTLKNFVYINIISNIIKITCKANSLVGDRINALKFFPCTGLFIGVTNFSRIGSTKQAVLPEPVRAMATTSLFSNAIGIV